MDVIVVGLSDPMPFEPKILIKVQAVSVSLYLSFCHKHTHTHTQRHIYTHTHTHTPSPHRTHTHACQQKRVEESDCPPTVLSAAASWCRRVLKALRGSGTEQQLRAKALGGSGTEQLFAAFTVFESLESSCFPLSSFRACSEIFAQEHSSCFRLSSLKALRVSGFLQPH